MNLRAVCWLLGRLALLLSALMLLPLSVSLWHGEDVAARAFVLGSALAAAVGVSLAWGNRRASLTVEGRPDFFRREGLAAVGLAWVLCGVLGAVPFVLSGAIPDAVDAFFESTSGFTTTGSSILSSERIEALPRGISFWRMFICWLGGIGIIVMFVVLFPMGGRSLYRSEVSGIERDAGGQRVRDSAIALARLYLGITVIFFLLLRLAGLGSFDAFLHACSGIATAGFSTRGASIAAFDSVRVEIVMAALMLFGGINFALLDAFLRRGVARGWRGLVGSTEVRVFAGSFVAIALLIAGRLWFWGGSNGAPASALPDYSGLGLCIRDATFTTASIHTTAGFATADFDRWPAFARALLVLAAVTGACAGSTSGGLKLVRAILIMKAAARSLLAFARPRAVHPVRLDGHTVDERTISQVLGFFGLWCLCLFGGFLALSAMNVEPTVALGGALVTLTNVGPGFGPIGPAGHFGDLPSLGKLVLAALMLLGRLEFYAIAVLVLPRFWRD